MATNVSAPGRARGVGAVCFATRASQRCSSFRCPDALVSLRTTGVPATPLDQFGAREHLSKGTVALAELSERDLVAHFTRLSHRRIRWTWAPTPLGSCTMKYNPKFCDAIAA